MIAVLQLGGVVLLIVALLAALEAWLGPPKVGRELTRYATPVDAEARWDSSQRTAWNLAAERRWRKRYERLPVDEQLGASCGPARDVADPREMARWLDDGGRAHG